MSASKVIKNAIGDKKVESKILFVRASHVLTPTQLSLGFNERFHFAPFSAEMREGVVTEKMASDNLSKSEFAEQRICQIDVLSRRQLVKKTVVSQKIIFLKY